MPGNNIDLESRKENTSLISWTVQGEDLLNIKYTLQFLSKGCNENL